MSMGSIPSSPSSPLGNTLLDPFQLSLGQQTFNTGAGITNQAGTQQNVSTPGYQQSWSQTGTGPGGVPLYSINQQFTDPMQQAAYSKYIGNQYNAGDVSNWLQGTGQSYIPQGAHELGNASNYQSQAANTLGGAIPYIQQAYGAAQNVPAYLGAQGAGNLLSNYAVPTSETGHSMLNTQAIPWLSNSGALQSAGEQELGKFRAQDRSMMGNMNQGMVGERMNAYFAGVQPEQSFQRNSLDNQLRNQGLHPGMPGYDNAMRGLDTNINIANNTAAANFEPQAWQQATQLYQDPLNKSQAYQQDAQSQQGLAGAYGNLSGQYGNLAGLYNTMAGTEVGMGSLQNQNAQTLGNIAGLQSGLGAQYGALSNAATNLGQTWSNTGMGLTSQALPWLAASAPNMPPQPSPVPLNIAPVNVAGIGSAYNQAISGNYANQLGQYNSQLANNQNMLSGLFGVGSSVLGGLAAGGLFSERSLKENIEPLGSLANGIPLYRFNYKWGGPTLVGPMVDEVEKIMPKAVWSVDGHKMVDYGMVFA